MSARNDRLLNLLAENRLSEVVECSVKKAINDALRSNCNNSENVMDIEFKNDAVCFAGGRYWSSLGEGYSYLVDDRATGVEYKYLLECPDFQLNTIKQGDYVEASELDSEQKYNDAVEVLGLFGFDLEIETSWSYARRSEFAVLVCCDDGLWQARSNNWSERKLTYNQLMAIGELKRLKLERDNEPQFGKNEDGSKYHREIIGLDGVKATVDVYRVLDAFKTGCAATDHAIKKMLCAGLRGHKDKLTDYDNAIESLQAAKELLLQKESKRWKQQTLQ